MQKGWLNTTTYFLKILQVAALLISGFLTIRWFYYIDKYSVNLLYKDQWGFYNSLFYEQSYWQSFVHQLGPHRMGLGLVVTRFLAERSHWDTRLESFAIGICIALACLVFFLLKRKLTRKVSYTDAVLPMLCLTSAQHEIFTGTPILAHGAMPLLLLATYCVAWTWQHAAKYPLILLLNFLLIFTGFGFFAGLISLLLLTIEYLKPKTTPLISQRYHLLYLIIAFASLGCFFIGYSIDPVTNNSGPWYTYFLFVFKGLGKLAETENGYTGIAAGGVVFATLLYLFLLHLKKLLKNENPLMSRTILILTGYTLLFLAGVAYGRTFLEQDIQGAHASRYIPHFIPGALGVYFYLCGSAAYQTILRNAMFLLLLLLSFNTQKHVHYMEWFKTEKINWRETYLQTESIEKANRASELDIYGSLNQADFKQKLKYLKHHNLNLFGKKGEGESEGGG